LVERGTNNFHRGPRSGGRRRQRAPQPHNGPDGSELVALARGERSYVRDPGVDETAEHGADVSGGQPVEAAESPFDQRRTAGDLRNGDQYARREAVDDDQGARLAFELTGVEQHQHAAHEEAEHADLDTERCRALAGDQQHDAREQRDDEEDQSLTGTAAVRLRRGEPRGVDRGGDEERAGERRRAADDGDPVVAPRLDVERHRWG